MNKFLFIFISIFLINSTQSCRRICKKGWRLNTLTCECRPPYICARACESHQYLTNDCNCIDYPICTMQLCPQGSRKNPRTCKCEFPQDYCDKKCSPDEKFEFPCQCIPKDPKKCEKKCTHPAAILNSKCECELPQDYCDIKCPPNTQFEFPCQCVPILSEECGISKCQKYFKLAKNKCQCRMRSGRRCKKYCGKNRMIAPGTCKCVRRPKCPIRRCKRKNYRFNKRKCKCLKRKRRRRKSYSEKSH